LKVVVGIPAFNEERAIAKVIVQSRPHVDHVLVVDDGSDDATSLIANSLAAVVVRHEKNLGKGAAIRDCFDWAKKNGVDVLVTMDGDGQHNPSMIPALVDALISNEADVAIASRTVKPAGMPRYRWLGGRTLDFFTQVKADGRFVDAQSGFRAYSRRAIESLVAAEVGMGVDSEIIMRAQSAGMKIVEVPAQMNYVGPSTSSLNPVTHSLDVVFSVVKFVSIRHPLSFYGGFGLGALLVSLVFGLMTLDYYQRWGRVITNLALISVSSGVVGFLTLFTGIILFTLITVIREQRK
jgi:glycosyltransferase involved in cell wall biosynthesis